MPFRALRIPWILDFVWPSSSSARSEYYFRFFRFDRNVLQFYEIFQMAKMKFRDLILRQHVDHSVSLNHFKRHKQNKHNVYSSLQGKYDGSFIQQEK